MEIKTEQRLQTLSSPLQTTVHWSFFLNQNQEIWVPILSQQLSYSAILIAACVQFYTHQA